MHFAYLLLEEVLDQNEGGWTSPGSDVNLFVAKGKDVAIKWYAKSQNITVNGDDRADIEVSILHGEYFINIINSEKQTKD